MPGVTITKSGPHSLRRAGTSRADATTPSSPSDCASRAMRSTALWGGPAMPISSRSSAARLVRMVTASTRGRCRPPVAPSPAPSSAARSIFLPPSACTFSRVTPMFAATRQAPRTVLGMSRNLRSRKTFSPEPTRYRASMGPSAVNASIPTLNMPTRPRSLSVICVAASAVLKSSAAISLSRTCTCTLLVSMRLVEPNAAFQTKRASRHCKLRRRKTKWKNLLERASPRRAAPLAIFHDSRVSVSCHTSPAAELTLPLFCLTGVRSLSRCSGVLRFDVPERGRLFPIQRHVALVFCKRSGKLMATAGVTDKVEIVGGSRMKGCQNGSRSRIADRAGRQSGVNICVIRRLQVHVGFGDRCWRQVSHLGGIRHGRIALKKHPFLQTQSENLSDDGALVGVRRFFFNQRRERQGLMEIFMRLVEVLLESLAQNRAETRQHCQRDACRRGVEFKTIGVRKKVTLKRLRLRIEVMDRRRFLGDPQKIFRVDSEASLQDSRDIEAVGAFRNNDRAEIDFTADEFPIDVQRSQRAVEEVLTCLDMIAPPACAIDQEEWPSMGDNAFLRQPGRNLRRLRSRRNINDRLTGIAAIRTQNFNTCHGEASDKYQDDEREDPFLQKRPPPASDWLSWLAWWSR